MQGFPGCGLWAGFVVFLLGVVFCFVWGVANYRNIFLAAVLEVFESNIIT